MQDFFEKKPRAPWAERWRPTDLKDVVGQRHLIGEGKPLTLAVRSKALHSMIFWGPPGVGKTTLAQILAQTVSAAFIPLSAILSGVKEIRDAVQQAHATLQRTGAATVVFVDEVHRFNKSQQDVFLPFVESGLFVFIGATTENPSFEVNSALLSRAQVYVLEPLQKDDLHLLVTRLRLGGAFKFEHTELQFAPEAMNLLIEFADGDARRLLNLLEKTSQSAQLTGLSLVTAETVAAGLAKPMRRFDKGGEQFYDQISALHKSVRGSDADAALYWLCRMLDGGAEPKYLARRIIRMAWEDVGLADPRALTIANEAATTMERLGSPEGELALAQAVIYLSLAPKSNAGYLAYKAAKLAVETSGSLDVPLHLRNAPTQLMSDLGYGASYRYAHDEPHAYAAGQSYWPGLLSEKSLRPTFYQPNPRGLEIKLAEKMAFLEKLEKDE
ncbi:MAG: replication-associated recombination protein A [Neisseriaceae bacterium]|nr:replication-associated recombination protein A [Neisseriaceae bacterium]